MKRKEVVRRIKGAARSGRVLLSRHALENDDAVAAEDILHALAAGRTFVLQSNGRWRVVGPDRGDDVLTVIVAVSENGDVIAWTTF